ncbi:MAG TPA: DUF6691 family protein, partial [Thermoleophilaceae bacterium]
DRIRDMLLLGDPYLYLMMFTAMAVGTLGTRLLARFHARALLTGAPVAFERLRPERRHIVGSLLFGLGWSISDSCPAPIAGQLAQGVWWSLATIAGVFVGIELYFRTRGQRARRGVAEFQGRGYADYLIQRRFRGFGNRPAGHLRKTR